MTIARATASSLGEDDLQERTNQNGHRDDAQNYRVERAPRTRTAGTFQFQFLDADVEVPQKRLFHRRIGTHCGLDLGLVVLEECGGTLARRHAGSFQAISCASPAVSGDVPWSAAMYSA